VLLTLMLLVLAAELMLNGYVRNVAGESGPRTPDRSRAAPAEVTGGGPVLRVAPDGAVFRPHPAMRNNMSTRACEMRRFKS